MGFKRLFFPFFSTAVLGGLNDNLFRNALVVMITYQMGYSAQTGSALTYLAMALLMFPFFPFSALAGQVADKFNRRSLIRLTKLVELVLVCLVFAALVTKSVGLLLALVFLMGTQSAFYSPLKYSYIPQMLPSRMLQANAYLNAGSYLGIIVGAILGNLLIVMDNGALFTGAALMLFALAGYVASNFIPPTPRVNPELKVSINIVASTWSLLRSALCDKTIRRCIIALSGFWMTGALYMSQLAPFCKNVLDKPPEVVLMFLLIFSIGVALGSLAANWCNRRFSVMQLLPAALVVMAVFTLDIYRVAVQYEAGMATGLSMVMLCVDLLVLAMAGGFYSVPLSTLLQRTAPKNGVAQVVAANNVVNSAMIAFGAVAVSFLTGRGWLSTSGVFVFVAVINLLTGIYLMTLRKIKL